MLTTTGPELEADFEKSKLLMGPGKFSQCSLDDPSLEQNSMLEKLRGNGSKLNRLFVIISGAVGSGKTYAAIAYAVRHSAKVSGMYGSAVQAVVIHHDDLAQHVGMRDESGRALIAKAKRTPMLVLDDLRGRSDAHGGKGMAGLVEEIINARYNAQKQTVITTNLTGQQFQETYGEPVVSRMRESWLPIQAPKKDYRKDKHVEMEW